MKRECTHYGSAHWRWSGGVPARFSQFQNNHIWQHCEEQSIGWRPPSWHSDLDCPSTATGPLQHHLDRVHRTISFPCRRPPSWHSYRDCPLTATWPLKHDHGLRQCAISFQQRWSSLQIFKRKKKKREEFIGRSKKVKQERKKERKKRRCLQHPVFPGGHPPQY